MKNLCFPPYGLHGTTFNNLFWGRAAVDTAKLCTQFTETFVKLWTEHRTAIQQILESGIIEQLTNSFGERRYFWRTSGQPNAALKLHIAEFSKASQNCYLL